MSTSKGRRRKGAPPAYLKHKASNRAYVFVDGKERYLGPYASQESRRRYREIVKAWEQEHEREAFAAAPGCSVLELVAAHAEHARQHYRHADGTPTSEVKMFTVSLRPLLTEPYAELPADEFRPAHLKALREAWIAAGFARLTCNQYVGRIRRLFRWGAGEELVSETTAATLSMVRDLAAGRSKAPDLDPVTPVPLRDMVAVLRDPRINPCVCAMIRLQYYSGARPGEVCRIRKDEIDQSGIVHSKGRKIQLPGVWVFQPGQYKQKHTGKILAYLLGERAREVVKPFLTDSDWLFRSPARKGQSWTIGGYQHSISDSCERLAVTTWAPNQLRHNFLGRVDQIAGIQAASVMVGHSSISTTQIYVEKNLTQAAEIAARYG